MAGKPDSDREALTEAYKKLVNEKSDVKDDDLRSLRSGISHLRVPPPSPPPPPPPSATPALHEQSQGNTMTTNPSMTTTTIKLLPTSAAVRLFSGNQSDYSTRQFIFQCEDVLNSLFVLDPADKISFVRSRLESGSAAANLLHCAQFLEPKKKTRIMRHFGQLSWEHLGETRMRAL